MSIMAKTPSGYKKIGSAYLGERPVDKVFNANGDVVYALQRELTGVPPLLFKGKEQSELLNYRIYGDTVDGNSVGDLVESGEHAGEYKVDVTLEGKNLLQKTATSQTINGVTFTVNEDGSVTCNGTATAATAIVLLRNISISNSIILSGCPVNGGVNSYLLRFISLNSTVIDEDDGLGKTITNFRTGNIEIRVAKDYTCDNITFYPMIRLATIEDDTYEPYHAPVTTPIYLPEPIKMVGDEAEYIDYAEQKIHRVRKNLIDFNWLWDYEQHVPTGIVGNFFHYIELVLNPNTTYNVSSDYPYSFDSNTTAFIVVNSETEINTNNGGVFGSRSVTTAQDGILKIARRIIGNNSAMIPNRSELELEEKYIQVEKGSIATEYESYIENTDLDVTLPALPTLPGTNVLSVDTEVQPSRMDIKGRIKSLT